MSNFDESISICIPTHNGSQHIEECLDSVLKQLVYPDEVIISDDNSTDNTLQLISEYKNIFHLSGIPLKIVTTNLNSISLNCNHLVSLTSCNYIKFLFQDYLLRSDCIKEFKIAIAKHPNKPLYISGRTITLESPENKDCIKIANGINTTTSNILNLNELSNGQAVLNNVNFWTEPINRIGEPSNIVV